MKTTRMKIPKQECSAEFKTLAVQRVQGAQTVGAVARDLGLVEQTLRNWVKVAAAGKLNGPGAKVVTGGDGVVVATAAGELISCPKDAIEGGFRAQVAVEVGQGRDDLVGTAVHGGPQRTNSA